MSTINVDKNIEPGEKITFRVDMAFYGYEKTIEFDFVAPRAAPLLNRIDTIKVKKESGRSKEKTKGNFSFTRCFVGPNIDKNHYALKVLMTNKKNANELMPGETVNFIASNTNGPLKNFHNKNFIIVKDTNKDPRYVFLRIPKNIQTVGSISTATGSLQEITGTTKVFKYTVTIPEKVFKGLVTEVVANNLKDGMVEDIPIFAFVRFTKDKQAKDAKKQLMINGNIISDKEPPDRNDVRKEYISKKSYSREFDFDENEKFIFYVAIARYTYVNKTWRKEWIQTNAADLVLWGKASEAK